MAKIKTRLMLALLAWLGVDSALDQSGKCLAVIDHRTNEPVFTLHHRFVLLTLGELLRKKLPFIPEKPSEPEPELEVTSLAMGDDEFEMPEPEEIRESFARYASQIEAMASAVRADDPRSERLLASQREIARALDVDLTDDAVWRGAMLLAYAVTSTSHTMAKKHIMWPPPFVLSDGAAAALCRTRQSLQMEGDLPDPDYVLPEDGGPDGEGWDDGSG